MPARSLYLVPTAILAIVTAAHIWPLYQPVQFKSLTADMTGVGPLTVGMTLEGIKTASRLDFDLEFYDGEEDGAVAEQSECYYAIPKEADAKLYFMMSRGRLVRVDIDDQVVRTVIGGLGIGSSEQDVYQIFGGRVRKEPHHYLDETGHYLIILNDDQTGILFETDEGRVITYRVGQLPHLAYVEHCL